MKGRRPNVIPMPGDHPLLGEPPIPRDLDAAAKKKWKELTKALATAGYLCKLDSDLLADYCRAFSEEQAVRKMLAKMPNPFVLAGESGIPYINPLRHVLNKARDQMTKLRGELGLGPTSRTRLKFVVDTTGTTGRAARNARFFPDYDPNDPTEAYFRQHAAAGLSSRDRSDVDDPPPPDEAIA